MKTLILEDFRCFAGPMELPIRPLTLLVGENSTGKSSFLAAVRAAHDLASMGTPDFNEDPFNLGSYDQIANFRGGRAGRARSFVIGQEMTSAQVSSPRRRRSRSRKLTSVVGRFRSAKAQPVLSEFVISSDHHALAISFSGAETTIDLKRNDEVIRRSQIHDDLIGIAGHLDNLRMISYFARSLLDDDSEQPEPIAESDLEELKALLDALPPYFGRRLYAFAPIRTSPRRTYDPITEVRDPQGNHIPMMLARLLGNGTGTDFQSQLEDFGQGSGLYSKLGIRKLGSRRGSDPFQIEVKPATGGLARNLIDVGYGVSQAIPIIADCVSSERGSTLLIQQPEVHLHPRAQAAMGSFFGQLATNRRNQLLVETHSDYLVDRIRMDVRDERLKPNDVLILYFEQGRSGVEIHPISVDANGRVADVPPGYRRFFLEEDRRFFRVPS